MGKVCGELIALFHLKHKELIRISWIGKVLLLHTEYKTSSHRALWV